MDPFGGAPEAAPELSLLGGPLHRLARRLGRGRDQVGRLWLAAALVLLTWVPTVLLALAHDNAGAAATLPGVGVHVRFLLALPLFLLAEVWADPHVAALVRRLVKSGVVRPTALGALAGALRRVAGLNQWGLAEALFFVLALGLVPLDAVIDLPGEIKSWTTAGVGPEMRLTPAGWWYHAVSLTVFRFLLLRWCWRTGIWWWFLWRLSRLDLRLVSTHPDRTGGLGYLEIAQGYFATEVFALSAVFSASFAEDVRFSGVSLDALVLPVGGTVLLFAVILLAPLLVFAPRLLEAKLRGLREYWELAERYVSGFDAKWIRGEPRAMEDLLGTPDIQSLSDLGNSLEVVRGMRVVPFGMSLVSAFALASLVPMAPLLLLQFPLAQLLTWLVRAIASI